MPVFPQPNVSGFPDMLIYINNISKWNYSGDPHGMGMFGIILLIMIFSILFMSMKARWPTEKAFASASFTTMLSSIMLLFIGIIPEYVVPVTIIMFAISIFLIRD